ncbi:phage tail protein [Pseudomonas putida]|uniref:tail protein X n=1 Tax=Pseudomonas putida TaxID=303 RepID=UPI00105A27EA|nr:tail protein X [Pseudomonas putida]TDJ76959.1 phage tail protein [Pseudomonas putida]
MAEQKRTQQNDTVDALCWRHYGRTAGVVEAVLNANPGLADQGPVLPAGLLVTLPDQQTAAPERQTVSLWD